MIRLECVALGAMLLLAMAGCGGGGSEPSDDQMRGAMEFQMNHPPGITVTEPIKTTFFKKEACNNPTPQGFNCTFTVQVSSTNLGASMYNNVSQGNFYKDKDSGKWMMRPPF